MVLEKDLILSAWLVMPENDLIFERLTHSAWKGLILNAWLIVLEKD